MFLRRCLAHDKAQIYRIFSYGAHTILSDQVLFDIGIKDV